MKLGIWNHSVSEEVRKIIKKNKFPRLLILRNNKILIYLTCIITMKVGVGLKNEICRLDFEEADAFSNLCDSFLD